MSQLDQEQKTAILHAMKHMAEKAHEAQKLNAEVIELLDKVWKKIEGVEDVGIPAAEDC